MKIGLGAVQFGLNYGVFNKSGQTGNEEVKNILEYAAAENISILDTAPSYGTSEQVLGEAISLPNNFSIITKTPCFEEPVITQEQSQSLETVFHESLERLNISSVYGLLIHNADDLNKDGVDFLLDAMIRLREKGLVKKIGVSVYTSEQIDLASKYSAIDLAQVPISVFDQRLIKSGHLSQLKKRGTEIHARSVLLQGLLLAQPSALPQHFDGIRMHLEGFCQKADAYGITPLEAALGFVGALKEVDIVLCGVGSRAELEGLVAASKKKVDPKWFQDFGLQDTAILNPSLWCV